MHLEKMLIDSIASPLCYSKDTYVVFGTCMVMKCKKSVFIKNKFGQCFSLLALFKVVTHVS